MTILASDLIDNNLLQRLSQLNDIAIRCRSSQPFIPWLMEYRTFSLGLARQTRKTTTLIRHLDRHAIMIVHNHNEANRLNKMYPHQLPQIFSPDEFCQFAERQIHGSNRIISKIFLDEFDTLDKRKAEAVYQSIERLSYGRYFMDNVFILKVGTPVC